MSACCLPTWRCHHPLPFLEEAGLEAVSGAEAVCLVSGHQLLHGLQNNTQLEEGTKRGSRLEITPCSTSLEMLQLIEVRRYQLAFSANDFICGLESLGSGNLIIKYRKQTNKHRAATLRLLRLYHRGKQFMFLSIPPWRRCC